MTDLLTAGTATLDLRADDDDLSWLSGLDTTVLAVLGGGIVLLLLLALLAGWLVVRKVRRSPLVARGRELTARGRELGATASAVVAARRLPPGARRSAAELQVQVTRARGELRRELAAAHDAGAHLGDVPGLLPALEAEGTRVERCLRQQTLATSARGFPELEAEAAAYLDMLADVTDAVRQAQRVLPASSHLPGEVADAVSALRAHTDAYRELTAAPVPPPPPPAPR
ncbi:hypothetical protein [Trujillonella endophytica]|uniref:Uncharacterized protein n=1 Tax=Trujillonella endophytica TaxID=673521 RepID=A0A1H8VQ23_9ACTN|nr:hypothetical protein [Trujillella endophytica]SEP17393.1 hypothetical protein SAMN05660991_03702 [Trujillella endophytica]